MTEPQPRKEPAVRPDLGAGLSLWALIRSDYQGMLALDRVQAPSLRRRLDALTIPGFWAVVIFRIATMLHRIGLYPLARILWFLNAVIFGIEASPRAQVGPGLVIPHPVGTGFSAGTRIGRNVLILNGVKIGSAGYDDPATDGFPTIGDGCKLMDGAKVLGPVEIGPGAVIGVNALVMRSIPANAIVASSPGRVIARRSAPTDEESAADTDAPADTQGG